MIRSPLAAHSDASRYSVQIAVTLAANAGSLRGVSQ